MKGFMVVFSHDKVIGAFVCVAPVATSDVKLVYTIIAYCVVCAMLNAQMLVGQQEICKVVKWVFKKKKIT